MAIELWFTPNLPGTYEIACAELCGLAHYRMKGALTVDDSQESFDRWLQQKFAEAQ
jgi:cytochrome c oxidase subunit 2